MVVEKYRNILVAVDGSSQSKDAVHEAIAIAKRNEAELTMLTSIDISTISHAPLMAREVTSGLLIRAKDMLDDIAQDESTMKIEKKVSVGVAKHEIVNYAKDEDMDLIVMGATGKGAIERALVGSTTTYVVNHAPCNVLVVR